MANALNRTTKQYLTSVNTPQYPTAQWIIDPNLSSVIGFASKYWVINGDVVTLMTQPQRDALDAAELQARRDAVALTANDGVNQTNARLNAVLDAIDAGTTLAQIKTAVAAIVDLPNRTAADVKTAVRNKLGAV